MLTIPTRWMRKKNIGMSIPRKTAVKTSSIIGRPKPLTFLFFDFIFSEFIFILSVLRQPYVHHTHMNFIFGNTDCDRKRKLRSPLALTKFVLACFQIHAIPKLGKPRYAEDNNIYYCSESRLRVELQLALQTLAVLACTEPLDGHFSVSKNHPGFAGFLINNAYSNNGIWITDFLQHHAFVENFKKVKKIILTYHLLVQLRFFKNTTISYGSCFVIVCEPFRTEQKIAESQRVTVDGILLDDRLYVEIAAEKKIENDNDKA